jgi:hypothetical protein
MTVSWRRSASSRLIGSVSTGAEGAGTASEALSKSRIARSILRRRPSETPKSFKSWSVNSGRMPASMSLSAKRWVYSEMPSSVSHSAICCIASHRGTSWPI